MGITTIVDGEGASAGTDLLNELDATAGNVSKLLPLIGQVPGMSIVYVRTDASGNTCTISPCEASGVTIQGAASITLDAQWDKATFTPNADLDDWLVEITSSTDVSTHAALTAAHGAAGAVVGTTSTQTLTNKTLTSAKIGTSLTDVAGNVLLKVPAIALTTPVNSLGILNSETGNPPELYAQGTDTNIDVKLTPKGSGKLYEGTVAVALSGTQVIASTAAVTDAAAKACLDDIITALLASRVAQP